MTLAFVALRSALFAAGFLWLWTWVALQLRPFDPALGGRYRRGAPRQDFCCWPAVDSWSPGASARSWLTAAALPHYSMHPEDWSHAVRTGRTWQACFCRAGSYLLVLAIFLLSHFTQRVPPGLEGAIVFPMAIVPNLWGLWNVMYTLPGLRRRLSIGAFGSLLPLILVPAGLALASVLDLVSIPCDWRR
jgi:hypothetical protein